MNRASPAELRKAMEAADALMKAGILFVPIPVMSERDRDALLGKMMKMMIEIEESAHGIGSEK